MRWTWIDRFVAFAPGKSAVAVKNLSLAEDHFADHFPGFPVMPAPLILEGLAQTGGILVGHANNFEKNVVLAKMNGAKFLREASAGEQLTYTATLLDLNETGARVGCTAHSGTDLVAEVEIMFAHVGAAQLPPGLPDAKFVFSGELAPLLRQAEGLIRTETPATEPGQSG
jgi:3-hydroxyacyl-[acyl-carrier-protein] dehydratase